MASVQAHFTSETSFRQVPFGLIFNDPHVNDKLILMNSLYFEPNN